MFNLTLWSSLFCILVTFSGCREAAPKANTLRVATETSPHSLDPRTARNLLDATVLNMLYEGLMRLKADGSLAFGVARDFTISEEGTTYTFHLREEARWSNGDPVIADDFSASWKSQLDPNFPAPNAFFFYGIQTITAPDTHTLVVKLIKPIPYFPQLTACYPFFPVNSRINSLYPDWDSGSLAHFSSNGPFKIASYTPNNELVALRNEQYWDAEAVHLDSISVVTLDPYTSLALFEKGQLDWVGSPLSTIPADAFQTLRAGGRLTTSPAAATAWLRFNVSSSPLTNVKMRRALSLSLNRRELVDYVIQGNQTPTTGIVPTGTSWPASDYFADHDVATARQLLSEACAELGLTIHQLPVLTLTHGTQPRDRQIAQAIQQQWQQALDLTVELQALESKLFYEVIKNQDYLISLGGWFADFDDPINFLSIFESKSNGTNNTGWEHPIYQDILAKSSYETDPQQRLKHLREAEALLIGDMPIAPIYHYSLNSLKAPHVQDVGIAPVGIQIFRDGSLTQTLSR